MAAPDFGYRIAIDGFENIATDAGKAFTAISTGGGTRSYAFIG